MKLKTIGILFSILGLCGMALVGVVTYYHFDWSVLTDVGFYENLANPSIRIVRIQEGLRKEQVTKIVGDKLGWDEEKRSQFQNATLAFNTDGEESKTNMEGYYFPKTYMISRFDDPNTIGNVMFTQFQKELSTVKKPKSTRIVNENTALIIASIIQRESGGKRDMNLISGIIWNRIFKGMKLQVDATLQYAKGTEGDWWPQVEPDDKNIESPYNTYKYFSLPPSPIANPGLDAIAAAYNPQKTKCIFYLHDKKGIIHCSETYDGHKKNIQKYY